MENTDLLECLKFIHPASLNYQEWTNIGMILKKEGYQWHDWDTWSQQDAGRYHGGECQRKWESFGSYVGKEIGAGTLVNMAKAGGWHPAGDGTIGKALSWDSRLTGPDAPIIDKAWLEGRDIAEPPAEKWHPGEQVIKYLETIFEPEDFVGYVMESYSKDGRFVPKNAGIYSMKAGSLIDRIRKYGDDIGQVLGDYDPACGAWIRFNPLDGHGVKNANVSEYKYALIESDSLPIDKQNAIIRELHLPVAALVFSGKKSLHAIVRIDADSYSEYQKRVNYMYAACEKNGLELDKQNRNPSRLSRLPGVTRDGHKQFIVDTNIGEVNFADWEEWYKAQNDDLPDFENLADEWDNIPPLAPPLIDGVLRQGHKMLLSGPSKAGKSFALIELVIAVAEGRKWFGWPCAQGRIVYVNFELDRASCLHRFKDVYDALGIPPTNIKNIDIWNLRGKSKTMDALAPMLIRRASKVKPLAVILDPIYKVITGDENSADQMAKFCNQFDKVCNDVGCAVIYCHHHSKGAQGGKKSMDRASGSGVFARDPDALLDLIELPLKDSYIDDRANKAYCAAGCRAIDSVIGYAWRNDYQLDDELYFKREAVDKLMADKLTPEQIAEAKVDMVAEAEKAELVTAWRIDGTLREFPKFKPRDLFFDYPIHRSDDDGVLAKVRPEIEVGGRIIEQRDKSDGTTKGDKAKKRRQEIRDLYTLVASEKSFNDDDSPITFQNMFERWNKDHTDDPITKPGLRKRINEFGDFETERSGKFTIVNPSFESPPQEDEEE